MSNETVLQDLAESMGIPMTRETPDGVPVKLVEIKITQEGVNASFEPVEESHQEKELPSEEEVSTIMNDMMGLLKRNGNARDLVIGMVEAAQGGEPTPDCDCPRCELLRVMKASNNTDSQVH